MHLTLTKATIAILILTLWTTFSMTYIVRDHWQDFKLTQLTVAYNQGRGETVQQLIQEPSKCQPFNIYNQEQKVDLIAVHCLSEEETPENTTKE